MTITSRDGANARPRFEWALACVLMAAACGTDSQADLPAVPNTAAPSPAVNDGRAQPKPAPGADAPGSPPAGGKAKPPAAAAAPEQALSSLPRVENPAVTDADRQALAQGNRAFAFQLYGALAAQESANLFFSPYSVSSALAMTYAGARAQTADQMRATLHFALPDDRLHAAFNAADHALTAKPADSDAPTPFTLDVANALWAQRGKQFQAEYLDTLATHYGAGVELLDFMDDPDAAGEVINDWVEDATHDRIKDLLHPGDLTPDTVLVLTNAIYFKGKWSHEFEQSATDDGVFHAASGDQTVPIMHGVLNTSYAQADGYQAIALPYEASSTEMLLILPDAGMLDVVETRLDDALFDAIAEDAAGYMVTLSLPRFRFESRFEVSPVLDALGMHDAFTGAADFSGMDGARDIQLSSVIHQAFVAVDEKGTEAAAATAVVAVATSAPAPMPEVAVSFDRPFIFAIRDRSSGDILFLGRVQSVQP
jgi:serpin B